MKKVFQLKVNGKVNEVYCHPSKTLLDVLREDMGYTASKECCGKGECGSCTALIEDQPVCTCLVLVSQTENKEIVTCEGIGTTENMDILQQAFVSEGATQCGYCTPGFIVSAKSLLKDIKSVPSKERIKEALGGNLCRCTGYTKIIKAVETAAQMQLSLEKVNNG
ncbi:MULTISPECIES: (2Fe-2S)-binding protein [unclassified Bacillus (in: firmicutes)]|uniref:(2Fe-2S)-binding protein n=1 Tax=unclassified Bacillus (in: firmicutes) TaxID=185979 RepID=UPI0008E9DD8C|nr:MULTISPECIES: (2Fe-2S)-binding protein [unclassified Bacillus (in: firmicutes)]SFB02333.1 purine hydroxylase delta subunit apoprotein [Bacillus sp. UNCCL13]SFQ89111.1 purine hydroxylase delta subunit apoprotein [Bacillus sp. cl95]